MRVALVHDFLVNKGGAERTVLALHRLYPDAPVFTALYHPETTFTEFAEVDVRTSSLQKRSKNPEDFRRFLPFFGRAMRRLDIEGFDIVLSSSTHFAHHVRPKNGCHIVYCHSTPRYLWDDTYDRSIAPRWARPMLPAAFAVLRRADKRAAKRAHLYVSNSLRTAERVMRTYGRRSVIVHPPVRTDRFAIGPRTGDYYLAVGRLLGHRHLHLAVDAFNRMGRKLIVVGDGPARADLERLAGPTIDFKGAVDDATLVRLYGMARGVVVTEEADFGMVAVEANASGRPVVAYARGGAKETVKDGATGVLFRVPSADAVMEAVLKAESITFDPVALRAHAERFGEREFSRRIAQIVEGQSQSCFECARGRRGVVHLPRHRPAEPPASETQQ
ncbi:MAG: glycosyltransferase [Actinomycetota bacterium]|nr:glycosyltransferase [Actinomycetota bacterium]